ncbi:site-specific integrase [Streptomyces sp. SID13666]|uniref:tyrosine-type recombinase/integrase n=1 Tax=unclassified Streptomyces TaxID=2593676 RepID=UPI0013BFF7AC|nr:MULTISPECIES: site-specific integrase [unclassified Streptomyces]NEA57989.1 site-specific integrase [Streptomyces sp. SID13666]NEA72848.1 site-specific integrase [Streptomyces sp. SID13588]
MSLSYEVEVWSIRQRAGRRKPYELRWRVEKREHSQSYRLKTQAEGRQSQLLEALRRREQFDLETGLPESELRALNSPTWYAHACAYALMKWPNASAKHRASIAETLATLTPVLVRDTKGAPHRDVLRIALYAWAFRFIRDGSDAVLKPRSTMEPPPDDVAAALVWIAEHSMQVSELGRSTTVRAALDALARKKDGTTAALNTTRRKYTVFSNALRYAVECDLLPVNPLTRIDWEPPETDDEVDFRYVPGAALARMLINAVGEQRERGEHLKAFFGCLYYAAMRPSEAAALGREACALPDAADAEAWGELILGESRPEVGSGWTDDGLSYEKRGLKHRARKATRSVPIPPELVRLLREHLKKYGTAADGRLFRAVEGGRVRSTEYTDLWRVAREMVLTPHEFASPLAEVPYSARQAGVSLWIEAGVDPVEVARRAGHSVTVLFRFYAKVIKGRQEHDNARISRSLQEAREPMEHGE